MHSTTDTYKAIKAGNHWCNMHVDVQGVTTQTSSTPFVHQLYPGNLFKVKTIHNLFESTPKIGMAICGEIELEVPYMPTLIYPKNAEIKVYCQIRNDTQGSEFICKGVYYIDTRSVKKKVSGDILVIHGYDAMLKLTADLWDGGEWNKNDIQTVNYICTKFGLMLNPYSSDALKKGYTIPNPGTGSMGYTAREVLAAIGALYGGNWIIDDSGRLKLIKFKDIPASS